jgi:polar amino acid transport system substrate-binding protein
MIRVVVLLAFAAGVAPWGARADDSLARVKARGELRWGMDSLGGAPYVFQDPSDPNHLVGFEVELAEALAAHLGVRARPVQGQWDRLLELLERGDFDIALNGIEVTEDKRRVVRLTQPYYVAPERLTVRRNDPSAPRDLAGTKGREVGTLTGALAERILARAGALVRTYDGGQQQIYDDLRIGRTHAVLLDEPVMLFYGAIEPELELVPGSFGEVRYAAALRPDDLALAAAIDDAIAALAADGTLRSIYERWGLWNVETGALLGQAPEATTDLAPAWESWRNAVGKTPPLFERLVDRYPRLIGVFGRAAVTTLELSTIAMALAIALGAALALSRAYGPRPLRWLALVYIELFRGTPLLVQLTMIYFGLPELGVTLDPFVAGCLALGLNYAAAEAENYRAGLSSVPAGQLEAARALGLTRWQALRFVIGPQAARIALPPTTNDFIALLKDSSLVSVVTLTELTKTYSTMATSMRDHLGLGLIVALWYLAIGLPFALLARRLEARLGAHLRRAA